MPCAQPARPLKRLGDSALQGTGGDLGHLAAVTGVEPGAFQLADPLGGLVRLIAERPGAAFGVLDDDARAVRGGRPAAFHGGREGTFPLVSAVGIHTKRVAGRHVGEGGGFGAAAHAGVDGHHLPQFPVPDKKFGETVFPGRRSSTKPAANVFGGMMVRELTTGSFTTDTVRLAHPTHAAWPVHHA